MYNLFKKFYSPENVAKVLVPQSALPPTPGAGRKTPSPLPKSRP